NPISSEVFCADPTAVEYNGRLYVYGTNDHQQCREKGEDKDNTYEKIKSLVVFSTDDMVNWVYHGEINVGEIAPWIMNSWAPTITSRVEEDGLTHFYLYFSNNGTGTGVITSTDPLGPWEDPLGKALVQYDTEGLTDCPNPFDPGVVIDDNGVGWLSFGAGKAKDGTDYMPGSARIVKLGKDMISFDSDFTEIPAPYLFEASELNYINGTYVYTYNCDWSDHTEKWDYDCPAPSMCSMVYMTTKTPLDPESWEMKGECFKNPGLSGLEYSNNHTHMHKYKDKWYMFYHTLLLKKSMKIKGGYRSLGVDEINVDEEKVTIEPTGGTKKGVSAADRLDPYTAHLGAELCSTAEITYDCTDMNTPLAVSNGAGSWINVKNVVFSDSDTEQDELRFIAEVKGSGRIEVRLGAADGELLTSLDFDSPDSFSDVFNKDVSSVSGTKDLYFVYSSKDITMKLWQFDGAKQAEKKGFDLKIGYIAAGAVAATALAVGTAVFLKKRSSHK
ncbi:MAG: family 43 glycosylhydrolase, partial [Ruminococcus sp.]|nr:family 43 glycosylhydrolase [Ruminococcus sp.]